MAIVARYHCGGEIRMGSPWVTGEMELEGDWVPFSSRHDFLPPHATSDDGRYLALAEWDVAGNVPGFRLWVIDAAERRSARSERFFLKVAVELAWDGDEIVMTLDAPGTEELSTLRVRRETVLGPQ